MTRSIKLQFLGSADRAFPIAVANNLSFVYAFFMAYRWATANPRLEAASLGQFSLPSSSLPSGLGVWLVIALLLASLASLASFAISHFCYIRICYIRKIQPSQ